MTKRNKPAVIVLAEDDDDDYVLTKDALQESQVSNDLHRVADGEELMDYLSRRGLYEHPESSPTACLILLDLNMPRKDGRECLREIRANPALRHLPVVILTTSKAEEDVAGCYAEGVSSFIRKPVSFEGLVTAMKVLGRYWFEIVEMPTEDVPRYGSN
jgi:CheY-like chemotaxis protein